MIANQNVVKMCLLAFETNNFKRLVGKFIFPINPETYSENLKFELEKTRGHGQMGTNPRFKSVAPEEFKVDFTLDGTGTVAGYIYNVSVDKQIALFKYVVGYNGNIHRPNFLKFFWGAGEIHFPCVISSLDINYTLFDKIGRPLRAKINATFINHCSPKLRIAKQNDKSPDLTRRVIVQEGDRLDYLADKFYEDSQFVLQLAKANRLTSIRNQPVGRELRFPPVNKVTSEDS